MRPSWKLHLGHYVWALDNWLKIQDIPNIKCQFLLADYHVMGDKQNIEQIKTDVFEVLKDWIAVWLDPNKADFVLQSYVPEATELMMFLMNILPISHLYQNPTLKTELDQLKDRKEAITAGFFNYPVSQAADILTPKATIVPVGDDQLPHIELSRELARLFNNRYGKIFKLPKAVVAPVWRLSWIDGKAKMSKSLWNAIYLSDDSDQVVAKVRKMYTDANRLRATDPGSIEGNVVFMHLDAFYADKIHLENLKDSYRLWQIGDVELKRILADVLNEFLDPIRQRRSMLDGDDSLLRQTFESGSLRAREIAQHTLQETKKAMGIMHY